MASEIMDQREALSDAPGSLHIKAKPGAYAAMRQDHTPVFPNPSGIIPIDLRVLVLQDAPDEKKGLIIMPDSVKEKEKFAQVKGIIIAVGENAWEEASARSAAFRRPRPGDRVIIGKYAGIKVTGVDGVDYQLMNDEDVIARLEE